LSRSHGGTVSVKTAAAACSILRPSSRAQFRCARFSCQLARASALRVILYRAIQTAIALGARHLDAVAQFSSVLRVHGIRLCHRLASRAHGLASGTA
jgi:hypothetical protein